MQAGDLSNTPAPRVVAVFEGTVGYLEPKDVLLRDKALRRTLLHRPDYEAAARCWSLNQLASNFFTNVIWRHDIPVDLLTFLHPEEARHVRTWLEDMGAPFAHVYVVKDRESFARGLGNSPHIFAIWDLEQPAAFGYKGRGELVFR